MTHAGMPYCITGWVGSDKKVPEQRLSLDLCEPHLLLEVCHVH